MSKAYNIPNMLCYFRIAVIPVMTVLFFFDGMVAAWLNLFVFALAGLSDFLDGVIARRTGQMTLLGKFLDSSSDKMLVGASLILLVAFDRLTGVWIVPCIIILLREIFIAGLREFMAMYNVIVHISKLGKWKLTIQMFAMGWLVVGDYGDVLVPHTVLIGKVLFVFATIMTLISGWDYMREAWKTIEKLDAEGKH